MASRRGIKQRSRQSAMKMQEREKERVKERAKAKVSCPPMRAISELEVANRKTVTSRRLEELSADHGVSDRRRQEIATSAN
jgi:hypothetical protein